MGKKVFPDSDPGCSRNIVILPALIALVVFLMRRHG